MLDEQHTTMGLHHWTKHAIEKLGWVLMAKEFGYGKKVEAYKDSVERLGLALLKKQKQVKESDRKADLKILLEHVSILKKNIKAFNL